VRSTPVPTAILEPTLTSSKTNPDDIQLRDTQGSDVDREVSDHPCLVFLHGSN
jgi:hypothetical protein